MYVPHYDLCYNKEAGCGAGILAALGVMVYAAGIAAGTALTRWFLHRANRRTR